MISSTSGDCGNPCASFTSTGCPHSQQCVSSRRTLARTLLRLVLLVLRGLLGGLSGLSAMLLLPVSVRPPASLPWWGAIDGAGVGIRKARGNCVLRASCMGVGC